MWFEQLTGFKEIDSENVRRNIKLIGNQLVSEVNGKKYQCGQLEITTLAELTRQAKQTINANKKLTLTEVIADAQALHLDPKNAGSLFQVASQFNLLEMVSPSITPEHGITGYEKDHTQGPACAIAAGAGTVYRNYFVPLSSRQGQTSSYQVNCMSEIEQLLDNSSNHYWKMKNGYLMSSSDSLTKLNNRLASFNEDQINQIINHLMIGIQWDTQVTLNNCDHLVSQAYCSALPVAYNKGSHKQWELFANIILKGAYEATLAASVINCKRTGNNLVYLTMIGGGVFGNKSEWIIQAIELALSKYKLSGLDVRIVSYNHANSMLESLLNKYN